MINDFDLKFRFENLDSNMMKIKSLHLKNNFKIQKASDLKVVNKETYMMEDKELVNLQETEKS